MISHGYAEPGRPTTRRRSRSRHLPAQHGSACSPGETGEEPAGLVRGVDVLVPAWSRSSGGATRTTLTTGRAWPGRRAGRGRPGAVQQPVSGPYRGRTKAAPSKSSLCLSRCLRWGRMAGFPVARSTSPNRRDTDYPFPPNLAFRGPERSMTRGPAAPASRGPLRPGRRPGAGLPQLHPAHPQSLIVLDTGWGNDKERRLDPYAHPSRHRLPRRQTGARRRPRGVTHVFRTDLPRNSRRLEHPPAVEMAPGAHLPERRPT